MEMKTVILLLALLAANAALANETHDLVMRMSEDQRAYAWAKYLQSNGEYCPRVSRTFYQGMDDKGSVIWNADCVGGDAWSILIKNDKGGSAIIAKCAALKVVGSSCWVRLKDGGLVRKQPR